MMFPPDFEFLGSCQHRQPTAQVGTLQSAKVFHSWKGHSVPNNLDLRNSLIPFMLYMLVIGWRTVVCMLQTG